VWTEPRPRAMEAALVGAIGRVVDRVGDQGAVGWTDRADRDGHARLELRDHVESVRFLITDLMRESPRPAAANYRTRVHALRFPSRQPDVEPIEAIDLPDAAILDRPATARRIQAICYDDSSTRRNTGRTSFTKPCAAGTPPRRPSEPTSGCSTTSTSCAPRSRLQPPRGAGRRRAHRTRALPAPRPGRAGRPAPLDPAAPARPQNGPPTSVGARAPLSWATGSVGSAVRAGD
jgi:hypothetical protein